MVNTIGECSIQYQRIGRFRSDRIKSGFPGSDADSLFDVGDEDLPVADTSGLRRTPDGVDGPLDQFVGNHYFDLNLGQKVDNVFGAAIKLRVALLPAKPLGFGDGNALQSDLLKRFFDLVELEWLDDGFDFFHRSPPGHFRFSDFRLVFHVARGRAGVRLVGPAPGRAHPLFTGSAQRSGADFLKSRVYAKLLRRLISKCYQAFNRHLQGGQAEGGTISQLMK